MWLIVRYHCAYCFQRDKARVSVSSNIWKVERLGVLKLSCFDWMFNDQMLVENQLGGRSLIGPSALWVWGLWRIFHMTERPWDWRCWRVWGGSLWRSEGVDSLCNHPVRKPPLSFCAHISEQFPSLTAPPLPPPEKQNFEKFQVKNQPSNSTVGYSKEKKNKNQCRPSLRFWGSSRILFVTWKDQ